ncbi:hypothetical protein MKW94_030439 [Papaver nudicaule]|uniref:Uncharacterized protein n=1 Tax=Papaver nudicaule TaxID=74823 RepID=A0AA41RZW2_PAPNU|nr:hypothetical protein [Papaver nudicaule]
MEAKSPAFGAVIMGVLLMVLYLEQMPVEAGVTCDNFVLRSCYKWCHQTFIPTKPEDLVQKFCADYCYCEYDYPLNYRKVLGNFLKTADAAYATDEFCKLGCESSMCSNIFSPYKSAESVKEAAERCSNACFQFCNKKSDTAIVAAK